MVKDQLPYRHPQGLLCLRVATTCVLLGRAWEHWFYDPPYHALVWDHTWFSWFIEGILGIPWETYITTPVYDDNFRIIQYGIGALLAAGSVAPWVKHGRTKITQWLLLSCSILLFLLAFLQMKDRFWALGQLIEHAAQVAAPVLVLWFSMSGDHKKRINVLKTIIALTFIGHGLYAIGFYTQPPMFIKMIRQTTGLNYEHSIVLLKLIGAFDILAAIGIFIPHQKTSRIVLMHILLWGFITAFGRIIGNVSYNQFFFSLKQVWHLTLFRLPHGLLPLALLYFAYAPSKTAIYPLRTHSKPTTA